MKEIKQLSETEMEIMKVLWKEGKPMAFATLLSFFNDEKGKRWKPQTLSTFLVRLSDNGVIQSEQQGRGKIYWPALTAKEYERKKAKGILDSLYQGSVSNFLTTLYDGKPLTEDNYKDLKQWLSDKRK